MTTITTKATEIWQAEKVDLQVGKVTVGRGSAHREVPVIALLGAGGQGFPAIALRVAHEMAAAAAANEAARQGAAALTLSYYHDTRKGFHPRWPRVSDGVLLKDRRRPTRLLTDIAPKKFREEVLDPVIGPSGMALSTALGVVLSRYSPDLEPTATEELYEFAKLGVRPNEYGDPSPSARELVRQQVADLVGPVREGRRGGGEIGQALQAEIDKAERADNVEVLAAWLEVVRLGSAVLHDLIHEVQGSALQEVEAHSVSVPEPARRALVQRALVQGRPLHHLLYDPHPEFGGDTWLWCLERGEEGLQLKLRPPRLVGLARYFLRPSWFVSLLTAHVEGDQSAIRRAMGRYKQFLGLIADWRLSKTPGVGLPQGPDLPSGPEEIPVDDLELELADPIFAEAAGVTAGSVPAPDSGLDEPEDRTTILARLEAAVANPSKFEIFRRVKLGGEQGKDVAASLGVSPAYVSQVVKQVQAELRKNEDLRRLWEER